ncbi:MAG: argininosuccinate lyase [Prevotellaceae bacterium]|jgi:argininosuccinate lyase|nr:argininosuccinate lyase [Prevotellaceae bacterium]
MATLWNKGTAPDALISAFTVGNDREYDLRLAKYDLLGSLAHVGMLEKIGLLTPQEHTLLRDGLQQLLDEVTRGVFAIEEGVEDIHSQVEIALTSRIGGVGKKIHAGRSRNDQVLVDVKLYLKAEALHIKSRVVALFEQFQALSETHKEALMPGYTHTQVAMPSSFGLWFGAYAETLIDDLYVLHAAYGVVNQNPLGSAAGYGSSFPLDRDLTTSELGFRTMNYNAIAAQLSRGKSEKAMAQGISAIAATLNKFAADCVLYMSQNFGFISFPDELVTGSSIMPHKKNPDVWELVRAKANRLQSVPNEIALLLTNLPHGYHRDCQLLKEILFPAVDTLHALLDITLFMLKHIRVNGDILHDTKYDCLFTVEEVNKKVLAGVPFRDAYRQVGAQVADGTFVPHREVAHTHKGSIGNLCTAEIRAKLDALLALFD